MTENKALYIEFCRSGYVPMHLQPWWLDAVCMPQNWAVALAFDGGGAVIGALPWYNKPRWGLSVIQLPPLTTYAGPWLRYPAAPNFKLQSRYAFEKKVCTQLIAQLPQKAFFLQNFHPEVQNWLPFYWEGFHQTTRYTYIFDTPIHFTEITAGMKNTLRSDLKKADLFVVCQQDDQSWETVFELNSKSFHRKRVRAPYLSSTFERLHTALFERGQMAAFVARDRTTHIPHAGLYLAADDRQTSILLTGIDPAHKASCAIYGLFTEAIKWCEKRNLSLDFEGSMQPEIEHTFRAFGARQQPYFQVWKAKNKFYELLYHLSR